MKMTLSEQDEMNFVAICGGKSEGVKAMRKTVPSKPITDPDFEYRPACATDLRETFRKAREAQQQSK